MLSFASPTAPHREGRAPRKPMCPRDPRFSYEEDVDEAPQVIEEEPVDIERETPAAPREDTAIEKSPDPPQDPPPIFEG